ncbi:NACHT domain- and WD repeat-containing protein 1 isoform X1 [Drosophila pseudoobscura]|uniref:NACHT domain- and WD repeat-containing protein 1 isoform X1 n=1 Tax=Drosophila pseudoobscura pseudoobscura TaxID=46245 RepID=A0A6I8VUL9_DROPS|nr:NACHT domain- and WD repeat-containing protein 1 isoform X1 [Drosophila pseudoobscura]
MAAPIDESVLNALKGVTSKQTRLPKPLLIKIYVASQKQEFNQERRMLLELVGPELQGLYDDRQIELEFVDMHFGTGALEVNQLERDPYLLQDYLHEIDTCHAHTKSVFFLALIGDGLGRLPLPTRLDEDIYAAVLADPQTTADQEALLARWYEMDPSKVQRQLKQDYRVLPMDEWLSESQQMQKMLEQALQGFVQGPGASARSADFLKRVQQLRRTQIEREVEQAMALSSEKILAVFRERAAQCSKRDVEANERLRKIKDELTMNLSTDNHTTLVVPGSASCEMIDPDNEDHESYLSKFKNKVTDKLRLLIEAHITNDPDVIKGRKKTVQEIFHEHATHLRILRDHVEGAALIESRVPPQLRQNLMANFRNGSRHAPYFICGSDGSGKSALISTLYGQVASWFVSTKVHRVIRFAKATPRSAYNLELLRVICQQISIIFNIPEGYLPKDASFDPLYISTWFQNLLRRVEDMSNDVLFLFIDDLHLLNPLDCDIVTALSWLPTSLPWNVQIICSSTTPVEQLKFTPMQRDRFKSAEYQFDLNLGEYATELRRPPQCVSDVSFVLYVEQQFDGLERHYGRQAVGSLAAYITCSEYGLSETELLELLMPTDDPESLIDTRSGHFSFATFKKIHREMDKLLLLHDKIMSGKVLIQWRHNYCAVVAKRRYMGGQRTRNLHMELANLFFPQDEDESTLENESTQSENKSVISLKDTLRTVCDLPHKDREREKDNVSAGRKSSSTHHNDDTSTFYNPIAADVSYSMRHVEESWHHLMRSDDTTRFKQIAVCNFDFLLAAVQTVSISYLRCLIEHVRCYILDRDIELIYYTIRKSSDVLTRDPMQLGSQLISWLRPISEHDDDDNSLLSMTVRSATAWCDGYAVPLLVPLTGWLPAPLPSQIRTMTVSGTGVIRAVCLAPSRQHLILATSSGEVQQWHIMSNSLEHIFKGHTAAVTCLLVAPTSEPELLLTGSEDTSVLVWHVSQRDRRAHINAHTAPITGVAAGVNNTLIISSSEDATIAITDLASGKLKHRISHHRGPVTGILVAGACDVLISGSHDRTICVWNLENFALLNTMQMLSPVLRIDISWNSVFLLALCEDNALYVRTLATGKELHTLKGHKSKIRTISIGKDSQRCVVGCDDTRALIYDMHSGKLVRSMPPNPGPVTAVYAMENDDFLVTVGGNKITFYSFRNEELYVNPYSRNPRRKRSLKRHAQAQRSPSTTLPPITCFDLSRDSQLMAIASGRSVHLMRINTPEYQCSLEGHAGVVNCLKFAPNGEFLTTGSDDRLVQVWNLAATETINTFKGHAAPVIKVVVLMDSLRVISTDRDSLLLVWMASSGNLLQTIQGPYKSLVVTNNMRFAASSNGDNTLKIWSLTQEDEKYSVSHSDEITCFEISADSMHIITGSRDMSLKVWQSTGGKLSQVLVGHSDAVTCVAVSVTNKTQVLSGSKDTNLILWDLLTGEEVHTLAGHLGPVIGVKVSADGSTAVSGSDDKTLIVWETKRGLALTSLQMHVPFTHFDISLEVSRVLVQLVDSYNLPVICLHNTPAQYVKLPTYSGPTKDVDDLRPQGPKRQMKRLLKKEVSLDTYTWQKKYGHLTSSVMMAQVDERLKRRFSVSASMEEISKIAENKTGASNANIGPEQAALAQSQHFDQLEALWNKRSPPRRRHNAGLSRQTSLVEDRLESSDDDEYQDERAGMLSASYDHIHLLARLPGIRSLNDAWKTNSLRVPRTKFYVSTPPQTNSSHQLNATSRTEPPSSEQNADSSATLHRVAPDLVRDLLHPAPSPAESPRLTTLRQFFHWPSLKSHLMRGQRQRNCLSVQPHMRLNPPDPLRPTPIIVVENCDSRNVQRLRTDLVLHPQYSRASFGHIEADEHEVPLAKRSSSSSGGYLHRRWHLLRHKSPSERSGPKAKAKANSNTNSSSQESTATCNECVAQ